MERRVALKSMALAVGALANLPAWASGWSKESLNGNSFLAADQSKTLAAIVETIIPKTDTPGAGELGVADFAQKMVKDCYDSKTQTSFASGISKLDEESVQKFGKSFAEASKDQRLQLVQSLEKSQDFDDRGFFSLLKNLTIQGYMTSEYVMTNITHYEMVPARFHGCVPVVKG
ncbi:gluconate 2-dehydrogenase subunit 3 family protein [Dyadobacter crusticola]|uniref:gluconate 2-dehydrogenase subunit 3 family protein n=1 Tax=Dyadobacter crusticola TaxID=292407 RepID=UPI00055147E0|nr:gluconate 2-dehydrogenase subunit 3 family protein [Dyadobacter crusticola]